MNPSSSPRRSLLRAPRGAAVLLCAPVLLGGFLGAAPQVLSIQKISEVEGGFTGVLGDQQNMPQSAAPLGDVDGDGVPDMVLGDRFGSIGGPFRGGVWVLLMNADGTVKSTVSIAHGSGGFTGTLSDGDQFGYGVGGPGDVDFDGVEDLAVGAPFDDTGGPDRGAVYVLFLNPDGTVKDHVKISDAFGMTGRLSDGDNFGASIAGLGNFDSAGAPDIVVGATGDRDGSPGGVASRGAIYSLFLDPLAFPSSVVKISETTGGFAGTLSDSDRFGTSVAAIGDLDGNGRTDLAVGATGDDEGGNGRGAVWILFLDFGGTAIGTQKIGELSGGLSGLPNDLAQLGGSLAALGDNDGDGRLELAVGAIGADDPAVPGSGLVYRLELNADGTVADEDPIGPSLGGGPAEVTGSDRFGSALAAIGDLDSDGFVDLLAGAAGDDDGGTNHGAAYVLFLDGCATPASATFRNDSGNLNPPSYRTIPPRLGETWLGYVDLDLTGHPAAGVFGYVGALESPTPYGILLVDPTSPGGELLALTALFGPGVVTFSNEVPDDASLCGFAFATQGLAFGAGLQLLNAQDLVVGF